MSRTDCCHPVSYLALPFTLHYWLKIIAASLPPFLSSPRPCQLSLPSLLLPQCSCRLHINLQVQCPPTHSQLATYPCSPGGGNFSWNCPSSDINPDSQREKGKLENFSRGQEIVNSGVDLPFPPHLKLAHLLWITAQTSLPQKGFHSLQAWTTSLQYVLLTLGNCLSHHLS